MKATIKSYIKSNPLLLAPVNLKVIDLLVLNQLELSEIAIVNIHNYLNKIENHTTPDAKVSS